MPQSRQSRRTPPEALDALRERLRATQEAAEKLASEAAAGADRVPPAGWDAGHGDSATSELQALLALLDAVRGAVPADLSRQLAAALRELLLALRALIDFYLERLGDPADRRGDVEVEDIPLD